MSKKRKQKDSPGTDQNPKKEPRKTMEPTGGKTNKESKNANKGQNQNKQASESHINNQSSSQNAQQYNGMPYNGNGTFNGASGANMPFMMLLNSPPPMMSQGYQNQPQQYQQYQQCSTPSTSVSPSPDMFTVILQRLEYVDNKLSQLDSIQKSIRGLTSRMDKMDEKIKNIEGKVKDLEESRNFDASIFEDMANKQKEIDSLLSKMKTYETNQHVDGQKLQRELTDLKCRSMRDNLMFYKLPEEKDENCQAKILSFIETHLKIENASTDIKLHRAHRIGSFANDKTRPIVAKFAYYPDREKVRKAAKNLRNTEYGISEQFPFEILEKRRKLVPIMKAAREKGKEAYLVVDKLYIDNELYRN